MDISEAVRAKIDQFFALSRPSLIDSLGIEFIKVDQAVITAKMPVDQRTHQPFGILHGGASVALAETLASVGAWLNIDETKENVVGLEINANHLRAVSSGWVTGSATPLHRGSKTQVWQVEIRNESDQLSCISRCTMIAVPNT